MRQTSKTKRVTEAQYMDAQKSYCENEAKLDKHLAKMNEAMNKLKEKYEPEISVLMEANEGHVATIAEYAEQNRELLCVDGKKSVETVYGTVGFKINPPKIVLPEGLKPADVVALFQKKKLEKYLTVTTTLDKGAIVKDREDAKLQKQLAALDVSIEQEETIYFKPKAEKSKMKASAKA